MKFLKFRHPLLQAKILESLEEKWNDIDRKAITYEVKHQDSAQRALFWGHW